MSDEYKDRYIILALLTTPPWFYTDNARTPQWFPANCTKKVISSDRTEDLPNTYSRSTAETTMNSIGQNIPVIYLHLEDTTNIYFRFFCENRSEKNTYTSIVQR